MFSLPIYRRQHELKNIVSYLLNPRLRVCSRSRNRESRKAASQSQQERFHVRVYITQAVQIRENPALDLAYVL